jgi:hypothetical protein
MNHSPFLFLALPRTPLLLAAVCCLSFGGACSSDSTAPTEPIVFSVMVSDLEGNAVDKPVNLRCDGTLAVGVVISSEPANKFTLRPAYACGTSTRCGYVRVEGLTADGKVLARVDTSTLAGVLVVDPARLAELSQIKLSVFRGLDQQPLQNPDNTDVTAAISPVFVVPSSCVMGVGGAGGAGGEGLTLPDGGVGGQPVPPMAGGAAGEPAALGGAAGEPSATGGVGSI